MSPRELSVRRPDSGVLWVLWVIVFMRELWGGRLGSGVGVVLRFVMSPRELSVRRP